MTGRRSIIALCTLCALASCGIAAQAARAATGTTGFTCKETGAGGTFSDAHCKTSQAGGKFKHEQIPANTETEFTGSNETTGGVTEPWKLKATIAGVPLTLTATGLTATGWWTGAIDVFPPEPYAHGSGKLHFSGVTASASGCKVYEDSEGTKGTEGVITTPTLTWSTTGVGMALLIAAVESNVVARFILEGCTTSSQNGTYTLTGSFKGVPTGTTVNFTHAATTEQNTLKLNGAIKAGIEGVLTPKVRANSSQSFTPLSLTTVAE